MAAEYHHSFGQSKFIVRHASHDFVVGDMPAGRLPGGAEIEDDFANRRMRVQKVLVMTAFGISTPVRQFAE
jgi:hypothetical protein